VRGLVLRKRLINLNDESGIALVMALGIMLVLTIVLTTVITFTASGARDSNRVNAGQKAYALAEAGINNALAVLHAYYPTPIPESATTQCILRQPTPIPADIPGGPVFGAATCPAQSAFSMAPDATRPNETTSYWGVLRSITGVGGGRTWVIRSTGTVPNPTGPGAANITRTITARVPVKTRAQSSGGTGVLDWVYSGTTRFTQSVDANSPFYVNGDVKFENTASINAKLYVTGNVTFENNGSFTGTKCVAGAVPGCVNIGGNLDFQNNNNSAGTTGSPLPEVHIAGTCKYQTVTANPCGSTPPTPAWTSTKIFATTKNNTLDARPFLPVTTSGVPANCANTANYSCIDYLSWYYNASPGPTVGCNPAANALPPSTFETDTTMNQSVLMSFNLTPATAYTCQTLGGELSWNPSGGSNGDGQLTIDGTVFIDGSAHVNQISNRAYSYTGVGQIMLSGSFSMQSGYLCSVLTGNGKACNLSSTNGWDPKKAALAIVADGNGFSGSPGSEAAVPAGFSAYVKNAQYQGIIAGTNSIDLNTGGEVQGPVMSVFGSVSASQSLDLTFPSLAFAPSSSPGQPPPPAELLAPRYFSGG